MATLLFLTAPASTPISPAPSAGWTHATFSPTLAYRGNITSAQSGTPLTTRALAYDASTHNADINALHGQFISPVLNSGQALGGQTVGICIQEIEARAVNNLYLTWTLYLVDGTGANVGTLVAIQRDPANEISTTLLSRYDSATTAAVTTGTGWRLCLEVGVGGAPFGLGTPNHNGSSRCGDPVVGAQLTGDGDASTTAVPWLNFSGTVTFYTPPPGETRVTQDSLEVLYGTDGQTRVTQDSLEIMYGTAGETRVTQDSLEILYDETPTVSASTRVTQDCLEILWSPADAPPAAIIYSYDEGQITTDHAGPGLVTSTTAQDGQVTTTHATAGKVGYG